MSASGVTTSGSGLVAILDDPHGIAMGTGDVLVTNMQRAMFNEQAFGISTTGDPWNIKIDRSRIDVDAKLHEIDGLFGPPTRSQRRAGKTKKRRLKGVY